MTFLKFFSFLVFNLSFYAFKKEIIDDKNEFIKNQIKELIPYFYNKNETLEEEISECKRILHLIELKKIEKFLNDKSLTKDFQLRLKYEIFKIKYCKNMDINEEDLNIFLETKFHNNVVQMYVINVFNNFSKLSLSIDQWDSFNKRFLSALRQINEKKAIEIEKKIRLIIYNYYLKDNFNNNSYKFFVHKFNKNCMSIRNNEPYIDLIYYSLIEFMLAQEDEELTKDAEKLFKEMKKKCSDKMLIEECEKIVENNLFKGIDQVS